MAFNAALTVGGGGLLPRPTGLRPPAGQVTIPGGFNQGGGLPLGSDAPLIGPGINPAAQTAFKQPASMQPAPQQAFAGTTQGVPLGAPPTGLTGFEEALGGSTIAGLGTLGTGIQAGRQDITAGTQGIEQQAALSGLRGPEAQRLAFEAFQASPGQEFLQEQAERALLRGAASTGGLGGGNVLQELQRQAIGLAQQDFSNQFQRGQDVLGSQQQSAAQLANLASQGGALGSQIITGAGRDIGQARLQTGQQLAAAAGGTAADLASLQAGLGAGLADITGQQTTNLANILSTTGQNVGLAQQQLATVLANIGTGGASQAAQFNALAAEFDAAGILGQGQAASNAIGNLSTLVALQGLQS